MDTLPNPNASTPNQPSEWLEQPHPVQNPQPVQAVTATPGITAPLGVTTPPEMTPSSPPPPAVATTPVVGFPQKKKMSGFSLFVILSIILLLGVWGVVGYLYYQNQKLPAEKEATPIAQVQTPSPTPELDPSQIQISNGSIVRVLSSGESKTLVGKESYPTTGITGFAKVVVSPDKTRLCFEALPPATEPALYLSNVDGSDTALVEKNRNTCTWLSDSTHILYLNAPIGTKAVDVYTYDINTKTEVNQTKEMQTATRFRQYAVSQTDTIIECQYSIVNASGNKLSTGTCQIDSQTGTVTDTIAAAP
jgi:hypothetical protein